jgi:hypothetical protein
MSTTVRNPERIRTFLSVLQKMEGQVWDRSNQRKFQILLIQYKTYGVGENQFYKDLKTEQQKLMDKPEPITYQQAEEILEGKEYVDGGEMRRRRL